LMGHSESMKTRKVHVQRQAEVRRGSAEVGKGARGAETRRHQNPPTFGKILGREIT